MIGVHFVSRLSRSGSAPNGYPETGSEGESLTTPSESVVSGPDSVAVATSLISSRGRRFKSCPRYSSGPWIQWIHGPVWFGDLIVWAESAPFPATTWLGAAILDRPRFLAPGRHRSPDSPGSDTATYNLRMITTTAEALTAAPAIPPRPIELPDGLTVQDALRIAEAVNSTLAASTRRIYDLGWKRWERWCATRGTQPLPASPALVCAYLTDCASAGASVPTLDLAVGAISYRHRVRGYDDPAACEAVRQVRRGLRRIVGTAPRRQARPLDVSDLRQILGPVDRATAKGARDAAIILLGFASALRVSELVGLTLDDVEHKPVGLLLRIHRSKTDQEAVGQRVPVAHGQRADTDPIGALDAWMEHRGTGSGPLFTAMRNRHVTTDPLSGTAIGRMLRNRGSAHDRHTRSACCCSLPRQSLAVWPPISAYSSAHA